MTKQIPEFRRTILLAMWLTVGCTGGGAAGCGSDGGGPGAASVDTELLGLYAVDTYQGSPLDAVGPDACDELTDIDDPPTFLVLYGFRPNDNTDESRIGGVFCATAESCQTVAEGAAEPTIGYSFLEGGNDQDGWRGFGIARTGAVGDQCSVDVQVHTLTAAGDSITINTDTVETRFDPTFDGTQATCRNGDALGQIRDDSPCKSRLLLEATRQPAQ